MARVKGARHRSSYIKELRASGYQGELDSLSYEAVRQIHTEVVGGAAAAPTPVPPTPTLQAPEIVVEPKVAIPAELAKTVYDHTSAKLADMGRYYNYEEPIPDRITDYLLSVYYASSVDEADAIGKRALEKFFSYLLHQWQTKHIVGPNTAQNIEQRAKAADSWAVRLEGEGKKEQAEKQRTKAAAIRATPPITEVKGWF